MRIQCITDNKPQTMAQKQNPIIESFTDHDGTLKLTVRQINVSLANAVRRTILADIPTYCFRTLPHA